MKTYKIEYRFLAFDGEDIEGYEYDTITVKAISPKQALHKAELVAPFNAKDFNIIK